MRGTWDRRIRGVGGLGGGRKEGQWRCAFHSSHAYARRGKLAPPSFCKGVDNAWGYPSKNRRDPKARKAVLVHIDKCSAAAAARYRVEAATIVGGTLPGSKDNPIRWECRPVQLGQAVCRTCRPRRDCRDQCDDEHHIRYPRRETRPQHAQTCYKESWWRWRICIGGDSDMCVNSV